jgi:type II secretory pathway component PulF
LLANNLWMHYYYDLVLWRLLQNSVDAMNAQHHTSKRRVDILKSHLFPRVSNAISLTKNKPNKDDLGLVSLIPFILERLALTHNPKSSKMQNQSDQSAEPAKKEDKKPNVPKKQVDLTSNPNLLNKLIESMRGSGSLSNESLQAFNNILFLVNSIPPSMNSLSIFQIMLRSSPKGSDLLPFLAQVKIPKSALGGTDYKTFITTLSKVQHYLPAWYYSALVLGKALDNFESILLYCAQQFARDIKSKNAVIGAIQYPAFMFILSSLGIASLLYLIVPQNIRMYEDLNAPVMEMLKWATYFTHSVQYHWLALLYLIPSSILSQTQYYLPFRSFLKWQYVKMHTPIGHLKFLQAKATLLHALSLLDKEQMTSKLLLVSTNLNGNVVLQHMVESMASLAKYGATADEVLAYMLKQKHVFSPYEIAYLQACFLSGKHSIIQEGLRYISAQVVKEYMSNLQRLVGMLGPISLVILGALLGVIVILGLYPMIEMTSRINTSG